MKNESFLVVAQMSKYFKPISGCLALLESLVASSCDRELDHSDPPNNMCHCSHKSTRNALDLFQTSSHKRRDQGLHIYEKLSVCRSHPHAVIQTVHPKRENIFKLHFQFHQLNFHYSLDI